MTFKVELILENLLDCTPMYIWAWEQVIEDYAWLFPYVLTTNDMYPPHDKLEGCTIKKFAIVGASTTPFTR